jgi:ATP-binding cassette, subfamily B, bacterial
MKKYINSFSSNLKILRRVNRLFFDSHSTKYLVLLILVWTILSQTWAVHQYLWGQTINELTHQKSIFKEISIIGIVSIYCAYLMCTRSLNYLATKTRLRVSNYLNEKVESTLWRSYGKLDIQDRENPEMQNAISDAHRNYNSVIALLQQQWDLISSLLTIIVSMAVIINLEWWYFIIILASILPRFYLNRRRKKHSYKREKRLNEIRRYQSELIAGAGTIQSKIHNTIEYFLEKYQSIRRKLNVMRLKDNLYLQRSSYFVDIWATILLIFVFFSIFTDVSNGLIQIGSLFLIQGAFSKLESSLEGIMGNYVDLEDNIRRASDFFMIIDTPPAIQNVSNPVILDRSVSPKIEFDNVSFKYPGCENYVLENVSFVINPGECIGMVGHNGSGKTTLSMLLLRFYDPTEGSVRINGIDIRLIERESLFSMTGCVFQNFDTFKTRIRESVYSYDPHRPYDHTAIEDASKIGDIHDMVLEYEEQYDQKIGRIYKGGINLSGGQSQKIAITGVAYRDPKLLILDELTSALDPIAEARVVKQYREIIKEGNKTCMIICQRLKSLELVDRIVMLDHGRVIESGTHRELMANNGSYKELFTAAQINI